MKVYVIIDSGGYYFNSDDNSDYYSIREKAYATKEKAYEQIIAELLKGEWEDEYGEAIILRDEDMPTIEDLLSGWIYDHGPEYEGLQIKEIEVIE